MFRGGGGGRAGDGARGSTDGGGRAADSVGESIGRERWNKKREGRLQLKSYERLGARATPSTFGVACSRGGAHEPRSTEDSGGGGR